MVSCEERPQLERKANMAFTLETVVILVVTLLVVVLNVLILLVRLKTDQLPFVNKYFFSSLTVADLGIGLLVTPFSLLASLCDRWVYGHMMCQLEAYVAAIFWIASVYSLTWLGIDHYVAIRKPERYESVMTPMRCICWVTLVWVAALSFCLPPLFGKSSARYYEEAYLCIIDWNLQKAYVITAGLLIIVPPAAALSFSNLYVFTSHYEKKKEEYEKCTELSSRPDMYFVNFVLGLIYVVSWLPWSMLQLHETLDVGLPKGPAKLHFYFMWLAVSNAIWKFVVYVVYLHDFRIGLKILYHRVRQSRTDL